MTVLALAVAACGPGQLAAPEGTPVPDPAAFEAELRTATLPDAPQQVNFAWTLDEAGSRLRGRGVVRYEAPERIRLDLFGPRGETYLVAALVGNEFRLPPGAEGAVGLPSPSLFWAALGVLEPPPATTLATATTSAGEAELRYRGDAGEVFAFTFRVREGAAPLLARVERAGRQGVIETVSLERDPAQALSRTRYRDWGEYRDLTLEIESMRSVAPFPASVWRPDAVTR